MKNQLPYPPPGGVLRPAEKGNFSKEFSAICYTSKWEKFHRRVAELDAQIAGMQWRNFTCKFSHSVFLIMLAHTRSEQRMHSLPAICLRALKIGW